MVNPQSPIKKKSKGSYDISSTYIKVRALVYEGFKKPLTTDSLLSQFPVSKAILKAICNYLVIDYKAVKSQMKKIIAGQQGYADDLTLAILDIFFLKVDGGNDPFYQKSADPYSKTITPEGSGNKWSALLKDYHSVKFIYTLIKDDSLENHKLEIQIVYKIYTDKYLNGYDFGAKASSDIEAEFITNFEEEIARIVKMISPSGGTRGKCPPEKEKRKIQQTIKMLHNLLKKLFHEVKGMKKAVVDSLEKYQELNRVVKKINEYVYLRNDLYNLHKEFFDSSGL